MDAAQPARKKLWLEGLHSFYRHGREWLPWGLVFFLIYVMLVFFAFEQLQTAWAAMPKHLPGDQQVKAIAAMLMPLLGWFVAIELVVLVQYYFYIVFFSCREFPDGHPELGIGRFFYFLGKGLQLALIFVGLGVLGGILALGIKFGLAANPSAAKMAALIVRLTMQIITIYIAIRYYLVTALAINKIRPVLRTSWRLTHGNWWRLIWNKIVIDFWLVIFFTCAFMIAGLVNWLSRLILQMPEAEQINPISVAVMVSLTITLCMGVFAAFGCAVCRALIDEKRQSDPTFLMETRV